MGGDRERPAAAGESGGEVGTGAGMESALAGDTGRGTNDSVAIDGDGGDMVADRGGGAEVVDRGGGAEAAAIRSLLSVDVSWPCNASILSA